MAFRAGAVVSWRALVAAALLSLVRRSCSFELSAPAPRGKAREGRRLERL